MSVAVAARPASRSMRWIPWLVFFGVVVAHALYIGHTTSSVWEGWADTGLIDNGFLGLGPYFQAQDYFLGFSYALGAAFTIWSLMWEFSRSRKRAVESTGRFSWGNVLFTVGLVSFLRWAVCFLLGCCGSPMLAVYAGLFGAKALGIGKPVVALITLLTVSCAYWCIVRRARKGTCVDNCCC